MGETIADRPQERARAFLAGEQVAFEQVDALWRQLKRNDELHLARAVLARLRADKDALVDRLPSKRAIREQLCQQEALLTSKDPELSAAVCHDRALEILEEEFDLADEALDDAETLGIAGGILKRRWLQLGRGEDLRRAAAYYGRAAQGDLGTEGYAQINSAFVEDLLAAAGDAPDDRRDRARQLRQRIVTDLPADPDNWWNVASRAEALFGLGRYEEATAALDSKSRPEPWQLRSTAEQLAHLAHLQLGGQRLADVPAIAGFFQVLLGHNAEAVESAFIGKVGLALSGGGFRASFYHLGVLARLAEIDALRHLEVLSCVSGGSIVGACYWLALRRRLLDSRPLAAESYIELVVALIEHFEKAVSSNLRGAVQPSRFQILRRVVGGERGVLDPAATADALEREFYRPLVEGSGPLYMDEIAFTPADHDAQRTGSELFNPRRHNWLRAHKVPALLLNATTVNTGHGWHFTPTWMGESPWSPYETADSIPRLEWSYYEPAAGWRIRVAEAVAASAAVPGLFAPLALDGAYEDLEVELVDGGVYDNQGAATLLAQDCNVVLVSDAAGQLTLQSKPQAGLTGLADSAMRSVSTLMERVRQANYSDLSARVRSGLLRGLMFLHMKAGLDADTIRLRFSQATYEVRRTALTPAGVRKEFQAALADLRTDLDAFSLDESRSLMACGYQMASKSLSRDLRGILESPPQAPQGAWVFADHLAEITSTATSTPRREEILAALRGGSRLSA
jgi:predicted acylesterase/phospholipase RssA